MSNSDNREHRKYFKNVIVSRRREITKLATVIYNYFAVLWFACMSWSPVWLVIKIFQVFTVFWVCQWFLQTFDLNLKSWKLLWQVMQCCFYVFYSAKELFVWFCFWLRIDSVNSAFCIIGRPEVEMVLVLSGFHSVISWQLIQLWNKPLFHLQQQLFCLSVARFIYFYLKQN